VQSTNGSLAASDKDALDKEFAQLSNEVDRIAGNSVSSDAQGTQYEIGPGTTSNDWISAPTNVSETLSQLSGGSWGTIGASSTTDSLHAVINSLDQAIDKTGNHRAELGAALSRFDSIISTMQVGIENTSAARSRIIDADFAAETSKLSQSRILQQAGTAMMAMATQQPQMVLQLLR
jgi:flagellin